MARKGDKSKRDADWARAKRLCRLSQEDVRMAKEMGMNPRKLVKNRANKSEPWKAPVRIWIRELYEKKQRRAAKKAKRKAQEARRKEAPAAPRPAPAPRPHESFNAEAHACDDASDLDERLDAVRDRLAYAYTEEEIQQFSDEDLRFFAELGNDHSEPGDRDIAEQNEAMLQRQSSFRLAAEYVARALVEIPAVEKVVLFGSVAVPLTKEVPRFSRFRRAGIAVWHECRDVDLAVWVAGTRDLKALQGARSQALNALLHDHNVGVAHHQVEIFLMEPGTERYLGRLCTFGQCPRGKPDCLVEGCGAVPFLRQREDFVFRPEALSPDRATVLYDTQSSGSVGDGGHPPAEP